MTGHHDLMDAWRALVASVLPNKPGGVPRVHDCRVTSDIFYIPRTGAPWRDLP